MRPQTHMRITYLAGKSMNVPENELGKIVNDSVKPDILDFPFSIYPHHYYTAGRNRHDASVQVMSEKRNKLGYKIHYFEDVGNPYHSTFLYLGRHFNYENIVDDNFDNWNLSEDVIKAPIEDNCISPVTQNYCEKVAIIKLGKLSSSMFDRLNNVMINENITGIKEITKYMIGKTAGYVKGLIKNYNYRG